MLLYGQESSHLFVASLSLGLALLYHWEQRSNNVYASFRLELLLKLGNKEGIYADHQQRRRCFWNFGVYLFVVLTNDRAGDVTVVLSHRGLRMWTIVAVLLHCGPVCRLFAEKGHSQALRD